MPRPSSSADAFSAPASQDISASLRGQLQQQLAADERVVWIGRPSPRRMIVLYGCSVLLLGAPIFVVAMIARFVLFSQPQRQAAAESMGRLTAAWNFLLFGMIGLLVLSRLWAWWKGFHTVYAITDRRALVLETFRGRIHAQSFSGEQLTQAVMREGPDGWGDLVFERAVSGSGSKRVQRDVGFLRIPAVAQVHRLLPVTPPTERGAGPASFRAPRSGP